MHALLLAVVLLVLGATSSAAAVAASTGHPTVRDESSIGPLCAATPVSCTVLPTTDDPDVGTVDISVGGPVDVDAQARETQQAIDEFTPTSAVESWAQAAAQGSVSVLAKIQTWQDKVSRPAFDAQWWRQQYAVMFGLSLILFGFLLVVVVARIGGPQGSVSAAQLIRDSGLRLWFVPAVLAVGPVVLAMLQGGVAELGTSFAQQSGDGAYSATGDFLTKMASVRGGFDAFGGAILALLILLGIMVFSVAVLIEVAVASWGLNLLGLVVPLALVMHVYPPWRRPLARVAGLMLGLMFAPVAVSFVYWAFWSTGANLGDGADLFGTALYVLVGSFLLAVAPVLLMWLFPLVLPGAGSAGASGTVARTVAVAEPRAVSRLSGHFRTKEALSAHAPVLHAPERAGPQRVGPQRVGPERAGPERAGPQRVVPAAGRDGRPAPAQVHDQAPRQRASGGDPSSEPDPEPLLESGAAAVDPVTEQLTKKYSTEQFDPEPFDPPRPVAQR